MAADRLVLLDQPRGLAARSEVVGLELGKACEIAVGGDQAGGAVLEADRGDLDVEEQVAAGVGDFAGRAKALPIALGRYQETVRRARQEAIEEVETGGERGRRLEYPRMRHDPQELGDAEDRKAPRRLALGNLDQASKGGCVEGMLGAVGGDQDVAVDRDQERSSMKS